jgi:Ca2+-binding RTX toxin-like protein
MLELAGKSGAPADAGIRRASYPFREPDIPVGVDLTNNEYVDRAIAGATGSPREASVTYDFSADSYRDLVWAGGGKDVVYGGGGKDFLYGNSGNDVLYGGADTDLLYGGTENDVIYGEDFQDKLYGEAGDDILVGGSKSSVEDNSQDQLEGGAGLDKYYLGAGDKAFDNGQDAKLDVYIFTAAVDKARFTTAMESMLRHWPM